MCKSTFTFKLKQIMKVTLHLLNSVCGIYLTMLWQKISTYLFFLSGDFVFYFLKILIKNGFWRSGNWVCERVYLFFIQLKLFRFSAELMYKQWCLVRRVKLTNQNKLGFLFIFIFL